MSKKEITDEKTVDARPVKSFFVSMLTRDIKLEDAILDLLDNCIDGISRSKKLSAEQPYEGYHAEIEFKHDYFSIIDNCGGIPWKLHEYAFRMGRADDRPIEAGGTVGAYGIGMKRAIFKMGQHCLISTQSGDNRYEVEIKPEWIADENEWNIPVTDKKKTQKDDGTSIYISKLYKGVSTRFGTDTKAFTTNFIRMIATQYAFIIEKGFTITVNGTKIKPKPTQLILVKGSGPSIKPYVFKTEVDGVEVYLTVGFTRPLPSESEIADKQEDRQHSTLDAGWTVLCNDRAVLYCDRTELTGWGEANVPQYHTQFIAISGIVEFKSKDPSKLPTTTTKRGIDASSTLYLQVKNKMREGMLVFINYTNKWKGQPQESKKQIEKGQALSFDEIKKQIRPLLQSSKKTSLPGSYYIPDLPLPKKIESNVRRIAYTKSVDEVRCVSEYLFKDENKDASEVGQKCFELILKEAK